MIKDAKLITIGNSKGVRLPKAMIAKYGLAWEVVLEEVASGILTHAPDRGKLSWEDTYAAMAEDKDDQLDCLERSELDLESLWWF